MLVSIRTLLVCVLMLIAVPAATQSTTEDGIRAFVRGDYQAAARILKPLADDRTRPDPVAQFFMAVLFYTGQGVGGDHSRACALFLRSAGGEHPLSDQAATISAFMRDLGHSADPLCVAEERWQGGPPVSFVLGPGHRIVFADRSITVAHGDKEHRTAILLPRGAAFLPIQHTPLAVTAPTRARRNFIQWFAWTPDSVTKPKSWSLSWTLFDVVDDRLLASAGEPNLAIVDGVTPPASYDVATLVRLEANANGEAEVIIAGGLVPRTVVISPAGDR